MTAGAEDHARIVQESRLADEPQGRTGRHPVVGQIDRIAVAGQDAETGLEGLVHLLDVMTVEPVVGVEHEIGIVVVGHTRVNHGAQQVRQRVSLADQLRVVAFDDMASHLADDFGGAIGTVVGHQPDIDQLARIGLVVQRVDEVADDVLLVARGDQHGVALVHRRVREVHRLGEQRHDDADGLVDDADAAHHHHKHVDYGQQCH